MLTNITLQHYSITTLEQDSGESDLPDSRLSIPTYAPAVFPLQCPRPPSIPLGIWAITDSGKQYTS
jgi:hypothetical protein